MSVHIISIALFSYALAKTEALFTDASITDSPINMLPATLPPFTGFTDVYNNSYRFAIRDDDSLYVPFFSVKRDSFPPKYN